MPVESKAVIYTLSCEDLRLFVEFSLSRGEWGRIGSSSEMEIPIPLQGFLEQECSFHLDDRGFLWLRREDLELPIRIHPPAYFRMSSYRFLISEEVRNAEAAVSPRDHKGRLEWRTDSKDPSRGSKDFFKKSAVSVALLGAGIVVAWGVVRSGKGGAKKITESAVGDNVSSEPIKPISSNPAISEAESLETPPTLSEASAKEVHSENSDLPAANSPPLFDPKPLNLEELASNVAPAVFLIQMADASGSVLSTGTGFAVSSDGLVVTNHHVVEHGQRCSLITDHGAKFDGASILVDRPEADLAVLKIEAKGLAFLSLATTSDVPVGKRVAVFGSPKGFAGTLSEGIISAAPRNLTESLPSQSIPNHGMLIQTTASVSPGSSGSPLFDEEGRVLGVMTMVLTGSAKSPNQSLNFAVPVEALKPLIEEAGKKDMLSGSNSAVPALDLARPSIHDADTSAAADPISTQLGGTIHRGEWVEALKLSKKLTEKYPESATAHFQNAYCASMLRLDKQAEDSYVKVIEIEPDNFTAWNNLGMVIRNQGLPSPALTAFEKAVAIEPDLTTAWSNIVTTDLILKNWDKASAALDTLSQLDATMAKEQAKALSQFQFPDAGFNLALKKVLAKKDASLTSGRPLKFRVVRISSEDFLTIRSGPGSTFSKVAAIPSDAEVFVVGERKINGTTEWLPIEYGKLSGWVAGKFLQALE